MPDARCTGRTARHGIEESSSGFVMPGRVRSGSTGKSVNARRDGRVGAGFDVLGLSGPELIVADDARMRTTDAGCLRPAPEGLTELVADIAIPRSACTRDYMAASAGFCSIRDLVSLQFSTVTETGELEPAVPVVPVATL